MSFCRWARQTREWNCQAFDTKSTTWCSSSISHDVICIQNQELPGMWYEINHMMLFTRKQNAREWKKDDVGTWMKVVGMIDHVWSAPKMILGTAWYVIRNWTRLLVSCYGKAHPCQDGTEAYGERNPAFLPLQNPHVRRRRVFCR